MVLLNIDIFVNQKSMINSIKELIKNALEYYIDNESLTKNKKKLMESIIKKNIGKTQENYFWYLNSGENVCTHVYKRGKNEGYMCQKKIKTNLIDDKADFLCCLHSKKHIPKKRVKKEKIVTEMVTINRIDLKKVYKNKKNKSIRKVFICSSGNINLGKCIASLLN
jgi:hypothetical protein